MATRSWDYTPSPSVNKMVTAMLRTPILHKLVSRQLLLLSFTGRKSAKHYTTPVSYYRQGKTIIILTKRFRTWWHNFQQAIPVEVCLEGKTFQGQGQALTDEASIIPIFTDSMAQHSTDASVYGVRFDSPGVPNGEDIRRLAAKIVVIQITLAE